MSSEPSQDQEMPLVAHLTELRTRLLRCVIAVLLMFAGLFYFAQDIYTIVSAPLRAYLPEGATMIATGVASPFLTPFKLTAWVALFLSIPVLLHQVWGCHFQKTTARNIRSRLHWWIAARCTGPSCSP